MPSMEELKSRLVGRGTETAEVIEERFSKAFEEMKSIGFPSEVIAAIRDSVDCNLYFFGNKVGLPVMYLILSGSVIALIGIYIVMNVIRGKKV